MITVRQFLRSKEVDPSYPESTLTVEQVTMLIRDYATLIRDRQVLLTATAAACYTAREVRGVPAQINNDLKAHLQGPVVPIEVG